MAVLYSALFIDYDNVRTELERYDPAIAARFSNRTLLWLDALQKQLAVAEGPELERRIVSRRCYASPQQIGPYRRNFTQTGFEVIDCPPLTTHLKNSADIYIVMDVIDYLGRYPHIDEYIILSGDADFVPVLNRLRKELKRSVIFASYNTTAAYRNCSDQRIEAEFFAEHLATATAAPRVTYVAPIGAATEIAGKRDATKPPGAPPELSAAAEECLLRAAARRGGRLPFATAAQALRQSLPTEMGGEWAGYGTFTALMEALHFTRFEIDWHEQQMFIPDFVLDLPGWDEGERERLAAFLSDVLATASKHVPILRPSHYSQVFDELAAHFQADEPGTFTQAINRVTDICRERGVDVTNQEVRFIATGISMQQYRFDESAEARHLASLWRAQIFDLCSQPDWMREPEDAGHLAFWIHASDESVDEAREDFLASTGDAIAEGAEESAAG